MDTRLQTVPLDHEHRDAYAHSSTRDNDLPQSLNHMIKANKEIKGKPPVVWLEGVLDYFNAPFPHGQDDPRRVGFAIGAQIIGLYLAEMLLQYKLDDLAIEYEHDHNLQALFSALPESCRHDVGSKYEQLLAHGVEQAWDFERTVGSFLTFLGDDPITDSRYFWEREHGPNRSIVFLTPRLRDLIYALFIALHQYPEGAPLEKRYETKFSSFEDSLDDEPHETRFSGRDDKRIKAHIFWLEGLLNYFAARCPHNQDDPRQLGYEIGRRIIGLYLIEMILKYAIDDLGRSFGNFGSTHNLHSLFKKLPRPRQNAAEKKHLKWMNAKMPWTWDHARTVVSHLKYLGNDPLTDARYFWLSRGREDVPLFAWTLEPLVHGLFIELHDYPEGTPLLKKYQTQFRHFDAAKRASTTFNF